MGDMRVSVDSTGRTAYVIGRFSPPHKGHVMFILWLLSQFDRVIIGIGSCYESGASRHPLLAVFREKMLLYSLIHQGVDPGRVSFVHLQDSPGDFRWWWNHVTSIPGHDRVTDFVTGNEDDILSQLDILGLRPDGLSFINPETDLPPDYKFDYHATDLREAIMNNDYQSFAKIAAWGTLALMGNVGGFETIRIAAGDTGERFVPGRQATDAVVICRSSYGKQKMVLCGKRALNKRDFPGWLALPGGAIYDYESPMDSAVRETEEETGLRVEIVARHLEPAHVLVEEHIATMRFVGLFGSYDTALAGTQGGSSQVFHIDLNLPYDRLEPKLRSESDLTEVKFRPVDEVLRRGLAFQQDDMLRAALERV